MRPPKSTVWISMAIFLALLGNYRQQTAQLAQLRSQFATDRSLLEAEATRQKEAEERSQMQQLADIDLVNGAKARRQHEEEWQQRLTNAPVFAVSRRERIILQIASISNNSNLSPAQVLEQVATLSSPRGAKIHVASEGGELRVQVVFDMSALTSGEQGARTKHYTVKALKAEAVELMARVFRDLYLHCGRRGISDISVACTHGVLIDAGSPALSRTATQTIYQCHIPEANARKVDDWGRSPLHRVIDVFDVQTDDFPNLRIQTTSSPVPSESELSDQATIHGNLPRTRTATVTEMVFPGKARSQINPPNQFR
jgi:hypothetical protein